MEPDDNNGPWWEPAVEIFGRVSTWVVVPILLALIIGKYLDTRYGTKPWIFLGLTLVAFLISSFGIVRTIAVYIRQIAKEAKEKNGHTK